MNTDVRIGFDTRQKRSPFQIVAFDIFEKNLDILEFAPIEKLPGNKHRLDPGADRFRIDQKVDPGIVLVRHFHQGGGVQKPHEFGQDARSVCEKNALGKTVGIIRMHPGVDLFHELFVFLGRFLVVLPVVPRHFGHERETHLPDHCQSLLVVLPFISVVLECVRRNLRRILFGHLQSLLILSIDPHRLEVNEDSRGVQKIEKRTETGFGMKITGAVIGGEENMIFHPPLAGVAFDSFPIRPKIGLDQRKPRFHTGVQGRPEQPHFARVLKDDFFILFALSLTCFRTAPVSFPQAEEKLLLPVPRFDLLL